MQRGVDARAHKTAPAIHAGLTRAIRSVTRCCPWEVSLAGSGGVGNSPDLGAAGTWHAVNETKRALLAHSRGSVTLRLYSKLARRSPLSAPNGFVQGWSGHGGHASGSKSRNQCLSQWNPVLATSHRMP